MANLNGNFPVTFPILDGRNYDPWSMKMKAILGSQDVWDLVVNGLNPLPENPTAAHQATYKDAKKKDCKGLCILHQCVNPAIFENIARSESSKAAWDVLANSYAGDQKLKKVRLQTLRRQYHFLRDQVTKGKLKLSYCRSEEQCADIFTKSLKKDIFKKIRNNLNLIDCNKLD